MGPGFRRGRKHVDVTVEHKVAPFAAAIETGDDIRKHRFGVDHPVCQAVFVQKPADMCDRLARVAGWIGRRRGNEVAEETLQRPAIFLDPVEKLLLEIGHQCPRGAFPAAVLAISNNVRRQMVVSGKPVRHRASASKR